ncbi:MAG: MoxR family ATPase [Elusimicrobiota bacterium]|nr:MoxR family ATPase [Elusimicrobiota bacterium]
MKKSPKLNAVLVALMVASLAGNASASVAAAARARVAPVAVVPPAAAFSARAPLAGPSLTAVSLSAATPLRTDALLTAPMPVTLAAPAFRAAAAPADAPTAAARMTAAAEVLGALPAVGRADASTAHGAGVSVENALTGGRRIAAANDAPVPAGADAALPGPSAQVVEAVSRLAPKIARMRAEFSKVIVGQQEMIDSLLMGVLLQEHISLEGLPGVAKTLAAETLGAIIGVPSSRIQGTPDLRPSDITGAEVIDEDAEGRRTKRFEEGPIFARIVLFDEINRAQPRTQSATLSVMQERTVPTKTGQRKTPLLSMIATQNPIEQDGTYRLPEAQEDRFMFKVLVNEPNAEERKLIMKRFSGEEAAPQASQVVTEEEVREIGRMAKQVYASDAMRDYINNVIDALKESGRFGLDFNGQIDQVMSTRASLMMLKAARMHAFMAGRAYVDAADVKAVAHRVMRHRIIPSYNATLTRDQMIDKALGAAPLPKPAK